MYLEPENVSIFVERLIKGVLSILVLGLGDWGGGYQFYIYFFHITFPFFQGTQELHAVNVNRIAVLVQ